MVKKFHGFLGEPQPMEMEWGESKTILMIQSPLGLRGRGLPRNT